MTLRTWPTRQSRKTWIGTVNLTQLNATSLKARSCSVLTASFTAKLEIDVSPLSRAQIAQVTMTQNLVSPIIAVVPPAIERTLLEATTARHESRKKKEWKKLFEKHPSTGHWKLLPKTVRKPPILIAKPHIMLALFPQISPARLFFFLQRNARKGKKRPQNVSHARFSATCWARTNFPPRPPSHRLGQTFFQTWKKNETRITEIKYNIEIKNQEKLITSFIARTLLSVSHHPDSPTCKRKHSKAITPDDDLKTWDSPRTLLFKHKISVMMTNHRNLSNAQRDFKDNKLQTVTENVEICLNLKKRLHLNEPPPSPSAILFQTLKRHFPKFKTGMHVGMRLIVKMTNQQIPYRPSHKPAKASRHISRKRTPKIP